MDTIPGIVVKVRLSDFTRVGALTLNPGEDLVNAAVIDPAGGFAYFGTDTIPGVVIKVRLSDFTRVDALTLDPGERFCQFSRDRPGERICLFWHGYHPGIVVKVQLSNFARVGALTLNSGEDRLLMASIDPARICLLWNAYRPGKVVKVRLSDFTRGCDHFQPGRGLPGNIGDRSGARLSLLWVEHRPRHCGQGTSVRLHARQCTDSQFRRIQL